jgi:DNA-binding NarL/FixJ family response regulator
MKIQHIAEKMRVTVELGELVIRIPFRVIFEKLTSENGFGTQTSNITRREEECLRGVVNAKANKEIAQELHVSERTVKFHVSSLLAKHKVQTRHELQKIYAFSKENEHDVGS